MTKVFFNPASGVSPLVGYGRVGDLNVALALQLILYHSLVSIAIPIGLTELTFPQLASRVWLSRTKLWITGLALTIVTFIGANFVFTYASTALDNLLCLAAIGALLVMAKWVGPNTGAALIQRSRRALFLWAFAYLTAILSAAFIMPALQISPASILIFLILTGFLAALFLKKTALDKLSQFTLIAGATGSLIFFDLLLAATGRYEMALVAAVVSVLFIKANKKFSNRSG